MEETGCEIICGAPTTLAVKGEMMMIIMVWEGMGYNNRSNAIGIRRDMDPNRKEKFITNVHTVTELILQLVSWCFKPSQPQRIISELRETSKKRYIVERTNKAEIRPKDQSVKAESYRENLWNEIQLKGP